ncbi:MAG: hypothetical protein V1701_02825 [Planctomycetota bacterium]
MTDKKMSVGDVLCEFCESDKMDMPAECHYKENDKKCYKLRKALRQLGEMIGGCLFGDQADGIKFNLNEIGLPMGEGKGGVR